MSSRLEDLRDLARMLDEGKVSQREFDIVKTELLEAPAEEWETSVASSNGAAPVEERPVKEPPGDDEEPAEETSPEPGWMSVLREIPTTYRVALAGAVLVLVVGGFIASRSDATGTVTAIPEPAAPSAVEPPAASLGFVLDDLTEGWNAVDHPPLIRGGISTSPEQGPLDSFVYRFDGSAIVAGAYDRSNGYVYALMARSSLHHEAVSNLYVHLCYLIHPGSQECLASFIEETGMFGTTPAELSGLEHAAAWEFEGHDWQLDIANDVETIRVQGDLER